MALGPIGMQAASEAASTAIQAGTGLLLGKYNDKRQYFQQKKLQNLQIKGQKEMGQFNNALALETWDKTNYEAQRRHLENAGLNAALMYGQGGGGGATTSTPTGNVSGANAPVGGGEINTGMGMQLGLQAAMMKAQVENIQANTEKTKVDTAKTAGVDTEEVGARIQKIAQETQNAQVQKNLLDYEVRIKEVESNVANATKEEQAEQIRQALKKLIGEVESAQAKGQIDQATKENVITQMNTLTQEQALRITGAEKGIEKTSQEIKNLQATETQTKQQTTNLQQDEVQKVLENRLREKGIQPSDNALFRKALDVLHEMGANPEQAGKKAKTIMLWLKGQAGEQTAAHLKELLEE